MKLISDITFPLWPDKSVKPNFGNTNLTETVTNLIVA